MSDHENDKPEEWQIDLDNLNQDNMFPEEGKPPEMERKEKTKRTSLSEEQVRPGWCL